MDYCSIGHDDDDHFASLLDYEGLKVVEGDVDHGDEDFGDAWEGRLAQGRVEKEVHRGSISLHTDCHIPQRINQIVERFPGVKFYVFASGHVGTPLQKFVESLPEKM